MRNLPRRAVDVPTIEHELKELWEQMTEVSAEEDQQAIMRACVANLVVYNSAGERAGSVSPIIAEVTHQHPSRVIVLLPAPESSQTLPRCHGDRPVSSLRARPQADLL